MTYQRTKNLQGPLDVRNFIRESRCKKTCETLGLYERGLAESIALIKTSVYIDHMKIKKGELPEPVFFQQANTFYGVNNSTMTLFGDTLCDDMSLLPPVKNSKIIPIINQYIIYLETVVDDIETNTSEALWWRQNLSTTLTPAIVNNPTARYLALRQHC